MGKTVTLRIDDILGGHSPLYYQQGKNQYLASLGIDPDFPIADSTVEGGIKASGVLRPVAYAKFSGANVNGTPIAIITNPKNALVYVVLNTGRLISYSSSLASETLVGTVAGNNAEGAFYYNNYIYILGTGASKDDVSRYGPLDGTPALVDNVWKGTTLGSLTALGNATYPSIRASGNLPKHWGFVHSNNKAYFLDYTAGVGYVHSIKTKKVTAEGDTNDGSAYNELDLPFGFIPTAIGSFNQDIVISGIQTTNGTLDQGKPRLFFWDPTNNVSWYRDMPIPDPIISAIFNNNGALYLWAGKFTTNGGYGLYQYIGGETIRTIKIFEEGHPPLAGAVDSIGDRIVWGSWITYPVDVACVWAYGSKLAGLSPAIHNIAIATSANSPGVVTALKFAEQGSNALTKMILGWGDSLNNGLDKLSTTYQTHYFRKMFNIGLPFTIKKISLPLGAAVAANMTLTPSILIDDASTTFDNTNSGLRIINNTNFPNSERRILQHPDVNGNNNFIFQLKWSGTALLPVLLPILIDIEINEE